ncbi:hypothetical protein OG897_19465 [Streptomyces sp. NBC_00237]|uniref:hypothetical protein n=1 Tax=Streptomyces sp. NBC_00237 TaxID=2975687 RepID=UPI002257E862|nr:hypothetical protein [Streptomyces sp. NBC_00237]MCX5203621.1 hypothetical protein [Streptomyces sp. NBC_00237]
MWDSERGLFVEYDGPVPHALMARVTEVGGPLVDTLALLTPGAVAAWEVVREPDEVPMPTAEHDPGEVLADLAAAVRVRDVTWPRRDDMDIVGLRALDRARCRDHLPGRPEHRPLQETEQARLLDAFTASRTDAAEEIGEDCLPRKAVLDQDQRALLPAFLRQWLTFALAERGVGKSWTAPVVAAVDVHAPVFRAAFDDEAARGLAKQVSAALTARGIDLTGRAAVDSAVRTLNAEQLAQEFTDHPRSSGL